MLKENSSPGFNNIPLNLAMPTLILWILEELEPEKLDSPLLSRVFIPKLFTFSKVISGSLVSITKFAEPLPFLMAVIRVKTDP